MRFLLDSNVLIALTDTDHVSHVLATVWFQRSGGRFATCPITQSALLRFLLRVKPDMSIAGARRFLGEIVALEGHEFWPDSVSCMDLPERGIIGYRQITDAYLVTLARHHRGKLATLNRSLAALHTPTATLISQE